MILSGLQEAPPLAKSTLFESADSLVRFFREAATRGAGSQVSPRKSVRAEAVRGYVDAAAALRDYRQALSRISMHIAPADWVGLNKQLENMFSEDAWDEEDPLPSLSAFETFLSLYIWLHPHRRPGMGSNGKGSFTATWTVGPNRLTVECLSGGNIQWVLTRHVPDREAERAAGHTTVQRIVDVLGPYDPEVWFSSHAFQVS